MLTTLKNKAFLSAFQTNDLAAAESILSSNEAPQETIALAAYNLLELVKALCFMNAYYTITNQKKFAHSSLVMVLQTGFSEQVVTRIIGAYALIRAEHLIATDIQDASRAFTYSRACFVKAEALDGSCAITKSSLARWNITYVSYLQKLIPEQSLMHRAVNDAYQEALIHYILAAEQNRQYLPNVEKCIKKYSQFLLESGCPQDALKVFFIGREFTTQLASINMIIGRFLLDIKLYSVAIKYFAKALEMLEQPQPRIEALLYISKCHRLEQKYEQAMDALHEASNHTSANCDAFDDEKISLIIEQLSVHSS